MGWCSKNAEVVSTQAVAKVADQIKNTDKQKFEENQKTLSEIMNAGYKKIIGREDSDCRMVMGFGISGAGKSTVLNLLYGTNFVSKPECNDVTQRFEDPKEGEKHKPTKLVDSVGFTPHLANFGKLILILFHRGFYPDHLVLPLCTDRLTELATLKRLVVYDYINLMVVPYNAKSYHNILKVLLNMNVSGPEAMEKSKSGAFDHALIDKISKFIKDIEKEDKIELSKKVKIVPSIDVIPDIRCSMKLQFLSEFFTGEKKDKKFITITYEEFSNEELKNDNEKSVKLLLYGLLIDAVKALPQFAKYDSNGLLVDINECKFLKD